MDKNAVVAFALTGGAALVPCGPSGPLIAYADASRAVAKLCSWLTIPRVSLAVVLGPDTDTLAVRVTGPRAESEFLRLCALHQTPPGAAVQRDGGCAVYFFHCPEGSRTAIGRPYGDVLASGHVVLAGSWADPSAFAARPQAPLWILEGRQP
jgi:hypothetical protein